MGMGSSFILVIFCTVFHQIYERKVRRIQHLQLSLVSLSSSKSKKHACIIIYICTVYIYSTVYVSLHGKVINMSTQKYEISKYSPFQKHKSSMSSTLRLVQWSIHDAIPSGTIPSGAAVAAVLQWSETFYCAQQSTTTGFPRDFRVVKSGCLEWHKQKNGTVVFCNIFLWKRWWADIGSLGAVWSVSMKGATIICLTKH